MEPIRLVIHGAAGRMGRRLVALAAEDAELKLVAALDVPGHPRLGEDAGAIAGAGSLGVSLAATLEVDADVVIDFSVPAGAAAIVPVCVEKKLPLVVATTGLGDAQIAAIHDAARTIPVLWSPNMSLAVNLGMKLCEVAARALRDRDADVEIIEWHHRFKEDAPSGTALKFGRTIAEVMGQSEHRHGRQGRPGARPHGEIGYHALRAGDHPGEHTILFGMMGETVEVTVRATSRDCYAVGALAAAKFLVGKPAGLYAINDVLGL
ncbi:MAG: 4-hydroxy-tetrahydrodipicolinate reductase [Planctomycetia bacterium]|nr:4-hydroxy-tetrahydrodipicolinate reductase [Planctomycetia bacterium]